MSVGLETDHYCLAQVLATELNRGKLDQRVSDGISFRKKTATKRDSACEK